MQQEHLLAGIICICLILLFNLIILHTNTAHVVILISIMIVPEVKWIIKAPFTTNSMHFKKYVDSVDECVKHVKRVADDIFGECFTCYEIPYLLLQERVNDNAEAKLCFLNKKFSHFVAGKNLKSSFPNFDSNQLIMFAHEALSRLTHLEHVFILDGLVRVDLFTSDGPDGSRLVVNEFESLEAAYYSTSVACDG